MVISAPSKPKNKPNKISYNWGEDHLAVTIGNNIPVRIRMLFWAEFLFTCGMTTLLLVYLLPAENTIMSLISMSGSALLYMLAAYRLLSRIFSTETLLLDNQSFTIISRNLFNQVTNSFEWKKIGPLHYGGKASKTDHPLKGGCFDYFGFETQEHLIQNIHEDGNLFFNYAGTTIKFARNVYSWDAEEMVNMMKLYAGGRFRLGPEWAQMQQPHEWDDSF